MATRNIFLQILVPRAAMVAMAMLIAFCGTTAAVAAPEDESAQILQAAGIEGGLVVHLGCGDGKLTAALDSVVGLPRRMQWFARPMWSRSHEKSPSLTGMVSAIGRVF